VKELAGRIAVVTGGSSGMGRELVRQLVAEACNVAMCDVSPIGLAETQRLCEAAGLPQGLRVTTHIVDVGDRTQVERFRDEVADRHQTDKIGLPAGSARRFRSLPSARLAVSATPRCGGAEASPIFFPEVSGRRHGRPA
jgi:NAD(P)-dependent dehydrogenase (short-subunit alcohol dehydrogenase family)